MYRNKIKSLNKLQQFIVILFGEFDLVTRNRGRYVRS